MSHSDPHHIKKVKKGDTTFTIYKFTSVHHWLSSEYQGVSSSISTHLLTDLKALDIFIFVSK